MLWPASGGLALRNTPSRRNQPWVDGIARAAARPTTDCAGMLLMSLSTAAWLQQPMTPPAFAKRRLDALGG